MEQALYYLITFGIYILYFLILIIIIRNIFKRSLENFHSNWNTLLDNFKFSTEEFYNLLKEELNKHEIKKVEVRYAFLKEGNIFSSRRTYLRVEWKEYQFDFCAAPFGRGFFLSWWLLYKNSIWALIIYRIPFIGKWLANKLYPTTYYKVDTASMFMTYAHQAVLKVIDDITNNKGARSLNENERKPVLNDIFTR